MAIKLRLVLKNPQSRLAFKALIFGGLLALVKFSNFALLPTAVFLAAALILYLRPIFQTFHYGSQLIVLLLVSLLLNWELSRFAPLAILASAALFYLLLGIKNLVFVDRQRAGWLFYLGLFYLTLLVFFVLATPSDRFIFNLLGFFVVSLFLFNGILKGSPIWSWVPSFLLTQSAAAIAFLPIGFLQQTNLAFLIAWLLSDLIFKYRQKVLNPKVVFQDLTVFILLSIVIFLTSQWSI